jgi:hypothetical protein
MPTIKHTENSGRQKRSDTNLLVGSILFLLLLMLWIESISLGILYTNDVLKGRDTGDFASNHLLTKPFASISHSVAGRRHIGNLENSLAWSQFFLPDGLLGWRLAPTTSAFFSDHGLQYLFITDENGFVADVKDPPVALEKPVNVYRVIVLGGSTVMGYGAPSPKQNIVESLRNLMQQRGLNSHNGKRIELINAGINGYNSAQEYLYFVSDLLRFKPDLVIVYDGWNDAAYHPLTGDSYWSPFRTYAHHWVARRVTQSYSMMGLSRLVAETLRSSLTEGSLRLGMVELPWRIVQRLWSEKKEDVVVNSIPFDPRTVEAYNRSRRAFLALGDDELSVALFLQPIAGVDGRSLSAEEKTSWWQPLLQNSLGYRFTFYEHARRFLETLRADNRRRGRNCIADLSHSLSDVSESIYVDTGHLSPKGNEIIAVHIIDELISCGLFK